MEAEVKQHTFGGEFNGKWYIVDKNNLRMYLHSDGKWHEGTCYEGKYSGYFKSRKAAEVIAKKAGSK